MPGPRFQFRLRTLFVVVTLVALACAYVGRQSQIVRERKAWLAVRQRWAYFSEAGRPPPTTINERNAAADPPLIRQWLGDDALEGIVCDSEADAALGRSLFPEAEIKLMEGIPEPNTTTPPP